MTLRRLGAAMVVSLVVGTVGAGSTSAEAMPPGPPGCISLGLGPPICTWTTPGPDASVNVLVDPTGAAGDPFNVLFLGVTAFQHPLPGGGMATGVGFLGLLQGILPSVEVDQGASCTITIDNGAGIDRSVACPAGLPRLPALP